MKTTKIIEIALTTNEKMFIRNFVRCLLDFSANDDFCQWVEDNTEVTISKMIEGLDTILEEAGDDFDTEN